MVADRSAEFVPSAVDRRSADAECRRQQGECPLDVWQLLDDLTDSLTIVELMMTMEEEFDLDIPDEDADKIKTVGDVIKYIETKASAS